MKIEILDDVDPAILFGIFQDLARRACGTG
jgi:hypothetical protein